MDHMLHWRGIVERVCVEGGGGDKICGKLTRWQMWLLSHK